MSDLATGNGSGLHNDGVTVMGERSCPSCGLTFAASGRQVWCSNACRQRGFRRRHASLTAVPLDPPVRVTKADTVYECLECEARFLGDQFCPDCRLFCRRLGPGGPCPSCEEPVALADLIPAR